MPDHPSKLQNVQPLTQPADSLTPAVVKAEGGDRGTGVDSGIAGAAEENVERLACDCEYAYVTGSDGIVHGGWVCYRGGKTPFPGTLRRAFTVARGAKSRLPARLPEGDPLRHNRLFHPLH